MLFLQKRITILNASAHDKAYHLIMDKLPYSYSKQDEVEYKIINATLKNAIGSALVKTLVTRDSKSVEGIQIADLMLGATLADWQGDVTAAPKRRVIRELASHLGWKDMNGDTYPRELKFNIWHFQDPRLERLVETRKVDLKIPFAVRAKR